MGDSNYLNGLSSCVGFIGLCGFGLGWIHSLNNLVRFR